MTAGYARKCHVSKPVCRQHLRGHCNFGDECNFVHKEQRSSTKAQPPPSPPDPSIKPHDLSQFKDVWDELLPPWATDREYIMDCLTHGFPVVDREPSRVPVLTRNYKSALEQCDAVEAQLRDEIANGHYRIVDERPLIVSALGAIPKPDGGVRLIHDASRPTGRGLNDYAVRDPVIFQTVDDAIGNLEPGSYQAVVDLKSAYRVCAVRPDHWQYTGLQWTFSGGPPRPTYMEDTRLGFGFRKSVPGFHRVTRAVIEIMRSKGYSGICVLLDDFHISASTYDECLLKMNVLLRVLRQLGFWINYSKIQMPSKRVKFLGVILDTDKMAAELPLGKVQELHKELQRVYSARKVSRKELERLCGRINWASRVVLGGRYHVRRILDVMATLKKPWYRTRVTGEMKRDIEFWLKYLPEFNGCVEFVQTSCARPPVTVFCDASLAACGALCDDGAWFHHPWSPSEHDKLTHINFKEAATFSVAAELWAPSWRGKRVHFITDNTAARGMLRKGSSSDPETMRSLRDLFWLSVQHNFHISVSWIPGISQLADPASRLNEPGMAEKLQTLFSHYKYFQSLTSQLPDDGARCRWAVQHIPPEFLAPAVIRGAGIDIG